MTDRWIDLRSGDHDRALGLRMRFGLLVEVVINAYGHAHCVLLRSELLQL